VAHTLLAVDDSVTMRKVLEITFAGPDFRVVTANSPDAALQKLKTEKPDLVITDGTLEPRTGYDLCKEIKKSAPSMPVLFLSSKQNPYDQAKGSAAQVDDWIDKPFDTQQMIDKVKKLLSGQPGGRATVPTQTSAVSPAMAAASRPVTTPSAVSPQPAAAPAPTAQRAKTLIYNPPTAGGIGAPGPAAAPGPAQAPTPTAAQLHVSTPQAIAVKQAPMVAAPAQSRATTLPLDGAGAIQANTNGHMAAKLGELGLSAAQIDAVLALSKEVVERVVWEVVPVLAETIIKEELARLTK
jgi:DNA-binding response OmpR family regulator